MNILNRLVVFASSLLLLIQVQLPAKPVGEIHLFFHYMTPEMYIVPDILFETAVERRICLIREGSKRLSREGGQADCHCQKSIYWSLF